MKIKKSKQSRKKIIASGAILLLLLVIVGLYVYVFKGTLFGWSPINKPAGNDSKIDYNPPTTEQVNAGSTIKEQSATDETKPGLSNEINSRPQSDNIDVTITATNKTGSALQVRALIGIVASGGICTLTMTNGSSTVTKSADVQALASESTCKGFDVPITELPAGKWTVSVQYKNGSATGESKKEVTI